jgi:hypothetical protein
MKMTAVAVVAAFAGLVVIVALVGFNFYRPDPLADARRSGDPNRVVRVAATIESVRDTGSRHNANPVIAFGLRFATADGRTFNVDLERAVPPLQLAGAVVGKHLVVEYDATEPSKAALAVPLEFSGG